MGWTKVPLSITQGGPNQKNYVTKPKIEVETLLALEIDIDTN